MNPRQLRSRHSASFGRSRVSENLEINQEPTELIRSRLSLSLSLCRAPRPQNTHPPTQLCCEEQSSASSSHICAFAVKSIAPA